MKIIRYVLGYLIIGFAISCTEQPKKTAGTNYAVLDTDTALSYISRLLITDQTDKAIHLLEKGVEKFPDNPAYSRRLSEAYIQSGRYKEALQLIEVTLSKDSLDFEAWKEKGLLLAQLQDTAAAIEALEKSFYLQPLQISGIALANLYAETKDPRTIALTDLLLKKDTEKELTDAVFIKGIYYSNTGNTSAAIRQYEECIKRDWRFTEAYIEKGILLYDQQHLPEALSTFQMAATVNNTYPDAYFWIGRAEEAMGRKQEAANNYYKALALDRDFKEAQEGLKRTSS